MPRRPKLDGPTDLQDLAGKHLGGGLIQQGLRL